MTTVVTAEREIVQIHDDPRDGMNLFHDIDDMNNKINAARVQIKIGGVDYTVVSKPSGRLDEVDFYLKGTDGNDHPVTEDNLKTFAEECGSPKKTLSETVMDATAVYLRTLITSTSKNVHVETQVRQTEEYKTRVAPRHGSSHKPS